MSTSVADRCKGRWILDKSRDENIDLYYKTIGVSIPLRAIAKRINVTYDFSVDDQDVWTMKNINTFKNSELVFKIGEWFDNVTVDGKHTKQLVTIVGNKLVFKNKGYCKHEVTGVMEFDDDQLVETISVLDVVARRTYKKEQKL